MKRTRQLLSVKPVSNPSQHSQNSLYSETTAKTTTTTTPQRAKQPATISLGDDLHLPNDIVHTSEATPTKRRIAPLFPNIPLGSSQSIAASNNTGASFVPDKATYFGLGQSESFSFGLDDDHISDTNSFNISFFDHDEQPKQNTRESNYTSSKPPTFTAPPGATVSDVNCNPNNSIHSQKQHNYTSDMHHSTQLPLNIDNTQNQGNERLTTDFPPFVPTSRTNNTPLMPLSPSSHPASFNTSSIAHNNPQPSPSSFDNNNNSTLHSLQQLLLDLVQFYFNPVFLRTNPQVSDIILLLTQHFLKYPPESINLAEVPQTGVVILDYNVDLVDPTTQIERIPVDSLQQSLHHTPVQVLQCFAAAFHLLILFQSGLTYQQAMHKFRYPNLVCRIINYPYISPAVSIGANLVDKFVAIRGIVTRLGTIRPLIISIPFRCPRCQFVIVMRLPDGTMQQPPPCSSPGCRNVRSWQPLHAEAVAIDWQQLTLQELSNVDDLNDIQDASAPGDVAGRIPFLLEAEIFRDLVAQFHVGDQVQATGIVRAHRSDGSVKSSASSAVAGILPYLHSSSNATSTTTTNMMLSTSGSSMSSSSSMAVGTAGRGLAAASSKKNIYTLHLEVNAIHSVTSTVPEMELFRHVIAARDHTPLSQQPDPDNNNSKADENPLNEEAPQPLRDYITQRQALFAMLHQTNPFFAKFMFPLYVPVSTTPLQTHAMQLSAKDLQAIAYIHKQPRLVRLLVQSLYPGLFGHTAVKFGVLLALFGGVDRSQASPQEQSLRTFHNFLQENNIPFDGATFTTATADPTSKQSDDSLEYDDTDGIDHQPRKRPRGSKESCIPDISPFDISLSTAAALSSLFQPFTTSASTSSNKAPQTQSGVSVRCNIHVLIVSEPGLGKSSLLRHVSHLSPRGVYLSGQGSSAAGLTASLNKERGSGAGSNAASSSGFTLEPGALVIGDRGVTCVDELDKMSASHRSLLEAMEQQTVSVAKAGTICQLPARTTVLAAANPRSGVYDHSKGLLDNLRLPTALLSRFDLCFLLLDGMQSSSNMNHGTPFIPWGMAPALQQLQHAVYPSLLSQADQQMGIDPFTSRLTAHVLDMHTEGTDVSRQRLNMPSYAAKNPLHQRPGSNNKLALLNNHNMTAPALSALQQPTPPAHEQSDISFFNFPVRDFTQPTPASASQQVAPQDVQIPSYAQLLSSMGYHPNQRIAERFGEDLLASQFSNSDHPTAETGSSPQDNNELLPAWLLRRYIAFAQTFVRPTFSSQAREIIQAFFLSLRDRVTSNSAALGAAGNSTADGASTIVTTRQLESLVRLCEARARLELRPVVLAIDAYEVVELMQESVLSLLLNDANVSAVQNAASAAGKNKQPSKRNLFSQFTQQLESIGRREHRDSFSYNELKAIAKAIPGFDAQMWNVVFDRLRDQCDLIMEGRNMFRYCALRDF